MSAAALALIYEHNASPAQVAAKLGLPESKIKSVVAQGLIQLATALCPPTL